MKTSVKVLLLSRYGHLGASSRVRFFQYFPYFEAHSVDITLKPLFSDAYLKALYSGTSRFRYLINGILARFYVLFSVRKFDVVIIEAELFPFFPSLFERFLSVIGVRYIVDYDDALFHRYDCHQNYWIRRILGKKIDAVMRFSNFVIVGNEYLAERARKAGASNIKIIPTVVDANRYQPKYSTELVQLTIGWIGTPKTSRYLMPLLGVFRELNRNYDVRFIAIGADPDDFCGTPIEVWSWSEASEVESLQKFHIGIMPLVDSSWERGKCGYKLIQYMACGLPVVASPVGVNIEIVKHGINGLLANTPAEWFEALQQLLKFGQPGLNKMGSKGREIVLNWYSLQTQAPRFLSVVKGVKDRCVEL